MQAARKYSCCGAEGTRVVWFLVFGTRILCMLLCGGVRSSLCVPVFNVCCSKWASAVHDDIVKEFGLLFAGPETTGRAPGRLRGTCLSNPEGEYVLTCLHA